jgi:hypothetical protein
MWRMKNIGQSINQSIMNQLTSALYSQYRVDNEVIQNCITIIYIVDLGLYCNLRTEVTVTLVDFKRTCFRWPSTKYTMNTHEVLGLPLLLLRMNYSSEPSHCSTVVSAVTLRYLKLIAAPSSL